LGEELKGREAQTPAFGLEVEKGVTVSQFLGACRPGFISFSAEASIAREFYVFTGEHVAVV